MVKVCLAYRNTALYLAGLVLLALGAWIISASIAGCLIVLGLGLVMLALARVFAAADSV